MSRFTDRATKEKLGTIRKSRKNPVLLKGRRIKTIRCPDWLGPIAAERWRWAVKKLAARGSLTDLDGPMLELFCIVYEQIRIASRDGQELKPSLVSQLRSLGEAFGLTPAARSRVHIPDRPKRDEDPDSWAAFRKRGPNVH